MLRGRTFILMVNRGNLIAPLVPFKDCQWDFIFSIFLKFALLQKIKVCVPGMF